MNEHEGGHVVVCRLRRAQASRGQALVEFSLVAPLFFLLLFGAITAGFYTLERASAVNAVTAGARIAAGGQEGDVNSPALAQAREETVRLLEGSLPGTRVSVPTATTAPCPRLEFIPKATVFVCASAETADTVKVEVVGHPAAFVAPQVGGLTLPLRIYAVVHTAVFKA
ncbi:MAG: TadE/TadG family type IV pilus assembly protein [Candidatus Dormibacteria bacterium]